MQELNQQYNNSQNFASSHYENFPVISLTLPKSIRKHVAVIYQFARQADDIADEGNFTSEQRIINLDEYSNKLKECVNGKYDNTFWSALGNTIDEKKLSSQYFHDLLSAFRQDILINRYEDFDQINDYCCRSANPIGRLMLQLFDIQDESIYQYSDKICTALQLTNFYQDVSLDILKNRIYIPLKELDKFGIRENVFEKKQINTNFQELMRFQLSRTKKLFKEGRSILKYLPKSFLVQMKMTILGGEKILEKIEEIDFDVLNFRPKLNKLDYLTIFLKGLFRNV